jgi:hypothetical protein
MIVTDRFVFLHLHKSGGSFVNEFLLRFIPAARQLGYHLPRLLIPAECSRLPVLGFVRNPWSYYVSWFSFQSQRPRPNALFQITSENGSLNFEGTLRNLLDLGSGGEKLDPILAALPGTYGSNGLNLPKFALAPIRHSGMGFYSYLYHYLYGSEDVNLHVERAESLRKKLLEFLEHVNERITPAMQDFILDAQESNTSAHGRYSDHYSPELRDLVAVRDRSIIERHGYTFAEDL